MEKFDVSFLSHTLELFRFQSKHVPIYRDFLALLRIDPLHVNRIEDIPFLPISFFKSHEVWAHQEKPIHYFQSSGTSAYRSKRFYKDLDLYRQASIDGLEFLLKKEKNVHLVALLPNYIDNPNSSLIQMVKFWFSNLGQSEKIYSNDFLGLQEEILSQAPHKKILLIGLSNALYDFAQFVGTISIEGYIIETGGNKNDTRLISNETVIKQLQESFPNTKITSEFGMCELSSQAYRIHPNRFIPISSMAVFVNPIDHPFSVMKKGRGYGLFVDIANRDSCAFIKSQDIIEVDETGFLVLGRAQEAEVRGCSLMYQ
ncbi:MAG: hypothetical protein MUE53_04025 [Chitinophagales bacterium]|jgi:hypothetical protein|nr:hypothetical protein [Chitinophagales bacterium]